MKNECEMMDNPQKCKKAISLTIPLEKTKIQTKTKQKKNPKTQPKILRNKLPTCQNLYSRNRLSFNFLFKVDCTPNVGLKLTIRRLSHMLF